MKKLVIFTIIAAAMAATSCSTVPVCSTSSVTPMEERP
jgi:hypothetical protein